MVIMIMMKIAIIITLMQIMMTKYNNIRAPQVHLYPTTLLKFTQFAWEATRTCKNSQDFSNCEPNVTLLSSFEYY